MISTGGKRHLFVLILLLFLCACASVTGPETHLVSGSRGKAACRVAVLPFINETQEKDAGTLMYRIFMNELTASGLCEVASEGDVRQFLILYRQLPRDIQAAPTPLMNKLAEQLKVDTVVRGRVIRYGTESAGQDMRVPYVEVQLEMVSADEGMKLLNTFHRRKGDDFRKAMHFGVIRTKTGLFAKVSEEVVADWREEGAFSCP